MGKAEERARYLDHILKATDTPRMIVVVGCDYTREMMIAILGRHIDSGRIEIRDIQELTLTGRRPTLMVQDDIPYERNDWPLMDRKTVSQEEWDSVLGMDYSVIEQRIAAHVIMNHKLMEPVKFLDERPSRRKGKGKREKDWEQSHYRRR